MAICKEIWCIKIRMKCWSKGINSRWTRSFPRQSFPTENNNDNKTIRSTEINEILINSCSVNQINSCFIEYTVVNNIYRFVQPRCRNIKLTGFVSDMEKHQWMLNFVYLSSPFFFSLEWLHTFAYRVCVRSFWTGEAVDRSRSRDWRQDKERIHSASLGSTIRTQADHWSAARTWS